MTAWKAAAMSSGGAAPPAGRGGGRGAGGGGVGGGVGGGGPAGAAGESLGHGGESFVLGVCGELGPDGGVDPAGGDGVDADRGEFEGEGADESFERGVGGGDHGAADGGPVGGDAGGDGERAGEQWCGVFGDEPGAEDFDVGHGAGVGEGEFAQGAVAGAHVGGGDDDVVEGGAVGEEASDGGLVGDVDLLAVQAVSAAEGGGCGVEAGGGASGDGDVVARGEEPGGEREAHAGAAADDEGVGGIGHGVDCRGSGGC